MDITNLIPIGEENAISRKRLAELAGMGDRDLRQAIEEARNAGAVICAGQKRPGGYFIAGSLDEVSAQYWQDYARAMSILKRMKTERRILKDAGYKIRK